ncbi:acyl-CoA synthetase (AMP-forming)/AMP-acid ligase II [Rhizobium petrolearium]|uniref:class I adenylate-forming enzyme family protein n=1 Tax=Neorhizobium petrolearium TaxID=515361 RepID=UPI001AE3DB61|nr:class I adenylate-forming enzyme family protein [Neorhizobium petrolearium]MBP1845734.1 acyl-CoA synthetase (AMP-forming)/AMP-acid ligase II [Neorhizobium petrolearium]
MIPVENLGLIIDPTMDREKPLIIGHDFSGTEIIFTAGRMDAVASAFARGLQAAEINRGERIGILAANSPRYIALVLGAMRAGVIPVPINYKFPPATISYILADSAIKLLVCDRPCLAKLSAEQDELRVVLLEEDELLDEGPFQVISPDADEVAMILYTSGSTGRPKGVLLSHAAHRWVVETRIEEYGLRDERVLIAAPIYHMNALALSLLVCASGSTAILLPSFQAAAYIEALDRHRCTWLTAVPPMIAMMLREAAMLERVDLSCVKTIRMGSAPLNEKLVSRTRRVLPNARIINAYGTTEGGPVVFIAHPEGLETPVGSVGYPHPQVQVRLVGEGAPRRGTLQIRSPGMMLGYLNRPATAITEDGFYDTGDVFQADDDGFFYFIGRVDDMFVSGGENIFPSEVEGVLEAHPDIIQACVVPIDDDIKGTKPVALVVAREPSRELELLLKQYVLANAPAYQHPRRIWFVDRLPLAATNKIDRKAVAQIVQDRMAADEASGISSAAS